MTRDGVYRCATGTSKTLPDSRGLVPGIHAVPRRNRLGGGARWRQIVAQGAGPTAWMPRTSFGMTVRTAGIANRTAVAQMTGYR